MQGFVTLVELSIIESDAAPRSLALDALRPDRRLEAVDVGRPRARLLEP